MKKGVCEVYQNRLEAGKLLADVLKKRAIDQPLVIALPRGGVPLAYVIANVLDAPMDVLLVRKIGHPLHPEYAIGALAEEHEPIVNAAERAFVSQKWLAEQVKKLRIENERRRKLYRPHRVRASIENRTVLLVDDGVATGFTLLAAVSALRAQQPKEIIVAVPVCSVETATRIRTQVEHLIVLEDPALFKGAVGAHYVDFSQVTDTEVIQYLNKNKQNQE